MHDLTIIKHGTGCYIDSREVAEVIGKQHKHLLRDIRGYCEIIANSNQTNFGLIDFFLESSFVDARGRKMPCYLLSKMACELVANKLTGEKGVLFTALYVAKFNAMEQRERETPKTIQAPRLGEYNAAARIIVRALNNAGAPSGQIMDFLKSLYEPLGFTVALTVSEASPDADDDTDEIPLWYTAKQIAEINGVYSLTGNPHAQAVSAILNENLFIGKSHKCSVVLDCGDRLGVSVQYDDYALQAVEDWIIENGCPSEIYGGGRTYHVLYDFQMK